MVDAIKIAQEAGELPLKVGDGISKMTHAASDKAFDLIHGEGTAARVHGEQEQYRQDLFAKLRVGSLAGRKL
jgi:hypothetical protein